MTLDAYFIKEGIQLFASLPIDAVPQRMPRLLSGLENPQSVVFAAIPYHTADGPANLARFARVGDYHVYAGRLGEGAVRCLKSRWPKVSAQTFADHSPFDEVTGAARAGLGILGDHGLLITKPYSSFVFLLTLVTDLPLFVLDGEGIPRGTGEIVLCEHCGACRAACPGACIGAGRGTCLSAITQKKGDLTEGEIALLRRGRTVWGCDACQDACPHTKAARAAGTIVTAIPYFQDEVLGTLTSANIREMTEARYRARAFSFRPQEVILRNLAIYEEHCEEEQEGTT